ncbi:MAG: Rieske 2Fe-2S domain-containing protein [archaeon]|nr:Rieske 2Fe-2S domain-containing protein [archaeon]
MEDKEKTDTTSDFSSKGRRSFLKLALAISVIAAVGGISSIVRSISAPAQSQVSSGTTSTETGSNGFPKTLVASLSSLQVNQPIYFNYPLGDEPNILVKLGVAVTDGVGPNSDIVAYSQICQHLGCLYAFQAKGSSPKCNSSYTAAGPIGYCCCHGSVYDFANDAKVLSGPAPHPVPRVVLDVDSSGNIYAVGMSGVNIYGHPNGDLQG